MHLAVVAALISAAIAGAGGWAARGWRCDAAELVRIEAQAEADRMAARKVSAVADAFETTRTAQRVTQRVVVQEVERVVDRPVYRDRECLDADGLRLVNAAAGAPANPGQPDAALPIAAASR